MVTEQTVSTMEAMRSEQTASPMEVMNNGQTASPNELMDSEARTEEQTESTVGSEDSNNKLGFLGFLKTNSQRKVFGIFVFLAAGLTEIGGGWLVWQTIRENRPWWFAFLGSFVLVGYGFVATLQPITNFARVYAIYGAFFILLSLLWGFIVDGFIPDLGDYIGAAFVFVGAGISYFWRR